MSTFLESRCRTMENVEHAMQGNPWQIRQSGRAVSTNQSKAFATIAESASCVCCRIMINGPFCEFIAQGSPQKSDKVVIMH